MTTLAPVPERAVAADRDRSLDLLRAACTVLVVLVHAMMVGVSVVGGAPVFENAMDAAWFAPASWFVQMMPLFFLAGGATAIGSWRRARARGLPPGAFVAGRIRRLLAPAVVVMAVMGACLAALSMAGVPADLVATAGFRLSQPLWFLGVFVLVQALVPLMVALHERSAAWGLAAPLVAVLAIDVARFASGIDAVGFLGLAAVWLLVQQLGFLLGEGVMERIPVDARVGGAAALLGLLVVLTTLGPYPADAYVNLNPPTLVLVVLAAAQLLVLSLLQPWLRRVADRPWLAGVIDAIGDRAMTIYLWHMPVLIGSAGLLALAGLAGLTDLPSPGTSAWWLSRPLWLAAVSLTVALVALAVGRFERRRFGAAASGWRVGTAAVFAATAVVVVFVAGLSAASAALSVALMLAALRLTGPRGISTRREDRSAAFRGRARNGIVEGMRTTS